MITCLWCGQSFIGDFNFLDIFKLKGLKICRLCPHCFSKFEPISESCCQKCGKEMNKVECDLCQDCIIWQQIYGEKILKNYANFRYNDAFHELMVNYKRYGDYVLRKVIQELIREKLNKFDYDLYVPVPSSPEHLKKRQFDTIEAIYTDLKPLTLLLKKKSGTKAQGQKNKQERLTTKQSFYVDNSNEVIDNKFEGSILLLDDIYTTGRTLYHARDALQVHFPCARIESFSICH